MILNKFKVHVMNDQFWKRYHNHSWTDSIDRPVSLVYNVRWKVHIFVEYIFSCHVCSSIHCMVAADQLASFVLPDRNRIRPDNLHNYLRIIFPA